MMKLYFIIEIRFFHISSRNFTMAQKLLLFLYRDILSNGGTMNQPIVFITKAHHHLETIQSVLKKHSLDYPVYYRKNAEECLELARGLLETGIRIIISTDYLCEMFMKNLEVSVISIRRSGYSFVSCVLEELKHTDKVAILSRIGGYSFGKAAEEAHMVNPEQVYTYEYSDDKEVFQILKRLKAAGFESIICPSWIGPIVADYGMKYLYVLLPEPDILEAVQHAEFQLRVLQKEALNDSLLSRILSLSAEGLIAIDGDGTIININDRACNLLKAHRTELLNRNYRETPLIIFDKHGELSNSTEVQRRILTVPGQMFIYDIQSIMVGDSLKAHVISFTSAQQIKETERAIRLKELKSGSAAKASFNSIIGGSPAMVQAIQKAKRFAQVDSTVLITAPSGCGKELFAQSIHNASTRSNEPFVVINCAALPESVLESILFGYEPGTFTGGKKEGKAGLFEQAHGGTVFLDEVSEMPLNIQARFLRVLQEREVVRIGGNRSIPINIRVLAATNRDMKKLIADGAFREDLYHRISTLLLELPSLAQRKEDIAPLSQYFVFKRAAELKLPVTGIDSEALNFLSGLSFTGNVRQLNNLLERAMVLTDSETVTITDIKNALPQNHESGPEPVYTDMVSTVAKHDSGVRPIVPLPLSSQTHEAEREIILQTLEASGGNRTKTASALGISTATLWRKMKSFHII